MGGCHRSVIGQDRKSSSSKAGGNRALECFRIYAGTRLCPLLETASWKPGASRAVARRAIRAASGWKPFRPRRALLMCRTAFIGRDRQTNNPISASKAITDQAIWDAVQVQLAGQAAEPRWRNKDSAADLPPDAV